MVFSSLTFLYLFLPFLVILYFASKNRIWQNAVLLVFSLLFYAWGEPRYIVLLLIAAAVAYAGGLLFANLDRQKRHASKKAVFIVTVVLLIGNLFVFKYFNFAADTVGLILNRSLSIGKIALPIGISFYTFQVLSYVIDLYRGEIAVQRNYFSLLLYVSFFPQLIAGPIVRYQTVAKELTDRETSLDNAVTGVKRFILGLCKKVLIANNVAQLATIVWQGDRADYGTAMYWLAALAYAFQIYFDFSGYSDMAIGLGRIFGFHFLENFDYPYLSRSVTEFWRRWHISLSSWFRDYVYIPLGGNRVSKVRWILNILIVWGLTGLWHGASWNFVLWGLYYAVLLLLEKLVYGRLLEKAPSVIRYIYTMLCVLIGWVLFSLTDPAQLLYALKTMFVWRSVPFAASCAADISVLKSMLFLLPAAVFSFPVLKRLPKAEKTFPVVAENIIYGALFILCIVFITSSAYNPFIYFRF